MSYKTCLEFHSFRAKFAKSVSHPESTVLSMGNVYLCISSSKVERASALGKGYLLNSKYLLTAVLDAELGHEMCVFSCKLAKQKEKCWKDE